MAWTEFKAVVFRRNPAMIGETSKQALQEKLDSLRASLMGAWMENSIKMAEIAALAKECTSQALSLDLQFASVLGTTEWESVLGSSWATEK